MALAVDTIDGHDLSYKTSSVTYKQVFYWLIPYAAKLSSGKTFAVFTILHSIANIFPQNFVE